MRLNLNEYKRLLRNLSQVDYDILLDMYDDTEISRWDESQNNGLESQFGVWLSTQSLAERSLLNETLFLLVLLLWSTAALAKGPRRRPTWSCTKRWASGSRPWPCCSWPPRGWWPTAWPCPCCCQTDWPTCSTAPWPLSQCSTTSTSCATSSSPSGSITGRWEWRTSHSFPR